MQIYGLRVMVDLREVFLEVFEVMVAVVLMEVFGLNLNDNW